MIALIIADLELSEHSLISEVAAATRMHRVARVGWEVGGLSPPTVTILTIGDSLVAFTSPLP
jgi:hypothetical protein